MDQRKALFLPLFGIAMVCCSLINGWTNIANCKYYSETLFIISSVSGTFFVLILSECIKKLKPMKAFFSFVGRYSLSFFMLEGFVTTAFRADTLFGVARTGTPTKKAIIVAFLYVLIISPIAYLTGEFLNRIRKHLMKYCIVPMEDNCEKTNC